GWSTVVWPESVGAIGLLLIVALATLRSDAPATAATPVAVAVFIGVAVLAFDGSSLLANPGDVQHFLAPVLVGVVFAPTLWWAMLVALRSGGAQPSAIVVFAAGLLWLLLLV